MNIDGQATNSTLTFSLHPLLKAQILKEFPNFQDTRDESPIRQHFIISMDNSLMEQNILVYTPSDMDNVTSPAIIPVPSLRALFRGNLDPGNLGNTEDRKYMYIIAYIEMQWLTCVDEGLLPIPRDEEMHEIYSALRRRPDGHLRVPNNLYSLLWQLFAFSAATIELSESEFYSITSRLIQSASTFRTHITSTNMYDKLRPLYLK